MGLFSKVKSFFCKPKQEVVLELPISDLCDKHQAPKVNATPRREPPRSVSVNTPTRRDDNVANDMLVMTAITHSSDEPSCNHSSHGRSSSFSEHHSHSYGGTHGSDHSYSSDSNSSSND